MIFVLMLHENLTFVLFFPTFLCTGSKLKSTGRSAAVEKKEKGVSAEEDEKPQKPREYAGRYLFIPQ